MFPVDEELAAPAVSRIPRTEVRPGRAVDEVDAPEAETLDKIDAVRSPMGVEAAAPIALLFAGGVPVIISEFASGELVSSACSSTDALW